MKPNENLVAEIAKEIFVKLNEKLAEKLVEEHQIGHSYFMGLENKDDLDFVLEYKIKPLLEEYFYGDTEGLNEILKILETPYGA